MKKFVYCLALVVIGTVCSAQSYFNKRFEYNQPGWWDGASAICQLEGSYVLGGAYQYYCPHCVGFYKMDFQGNKIISKTYCDDTTEYYLGGGGSIAELSSDSILAVGQSSILTGTWYHDRGILFFLNNDLDTLSTKQYGETSEPYDTGFLFNQLTIDPLKNIIVTGSQYSNATNGRTSILLVKTDRKGNLNWKRHYGSGLNYDGRSVMCTADGGYAIGGYAFDLPLPPYYSGDPVLVKTDSAGIQQWLLNLGGPMQDTPAMICNSTDGNIVVGTSFCDSMPGGGPSAEGNAYRRINIIKVDNSGNIIWNKKYGVSQMFNELTNIREASDGSLIACGITTRLFPASYDYAGWMMKTSQDGDLLWYRQYVVCNGHASWNWLCDVIQTEDKGFISGGIVYVHAPDTGSTDGWVLKVDSLGCENPSYCWVGMQPETKVPDEMEIKISPNPAEKHATISILNNIQALPVILKLYDLFGKVVKTVRLTNSLTEYTLDISELPDGIYLATIESDGRVIGRAKLVKHQ